MRPIHWILSYIAAIGLIWLWDKIKGLFMPYDPLREMDKYLKESENYKNKNNEYKSKHNNKRR
jgi:hypothetical protein